MPLDATILILSDGKMGDLIQCRGVAHALAGPENTNEYVVKPRGFWALPVPLMPVSPLERKSEIFNPPLPDIVIASGRRTVPYIRAFTAIAGGLFTVFLKDPREGHSRINFIWAPDHDGLAGDNVLATLTAPHMIANEALDMMAAAAVLEFGINGHAAGIILGGDSGRVKWTGESACAFADQLKNLPGDETPVVVSSRRTPDILREAVDAALPRAVWPERRDIEQPYLKTMAICDRLVVTGDSHNMVSEALATGAAVHVFRPPGLHRKLIWFLDRLQDAELIADLASGFDRGRQEPVNATAQIAAEIERRYRLEER